MSHIANAKSLIEEANEMLMKLRVNSLISSVTELDLYNVQLMLYTALDSIEALNTLLQAQISTISPKGVQDKGTIDYSAENKDAQQYK